MRSVASSRRPLDESGRPARVQRTQLLNLQPAGGKNNSSHEVAGAGEPRAGPSGVPVLTHIESLEEQLATKSQSNVSQHPEREKKRKRGRTHKQLTAAEQEQYMAYRMVTDLFSFEELKVRPNFAIKRYKESLYRGELAD